MPSYVAERTSPSSGTGRGRRAAAEIPGLDGRAVADQVDGSFDDAEVARKYEQFERRRGYEIG